MSSRPSAPPPPVIPDYAAAARETAAGNLAAARAAAKANRVNTDTPFGNISFNQDPNDPDRWTSKVTLNEVQQKLLDQQNQSSLNLAGLQDSAFDRVKNTLGQDYASVYDPEKSTNTAYESLMARLDPSLDRQQSALDTKLANQGIAHGSEAWKNANNQFGQTRNDAQTQAALQSILLGMQQQGQQFNQQTTNRNIPLNELNALRSGSQVTNPTQINAAQQGQTAGPNILGATQAEDQANQRNFQAAINEYNQKIASKNGALSGLFGVGSSLIGGAGGLGGIASLFSDVRLKTDIKKIGMLDSGIPVYRYMKFGNPEIGVLAHEAKIVMPDAVFEHESGYLMVDIGAF